MHRTRTRVLVLALVLWTAGCQAKSASLPSSVAMTATPTLAPRTYPTLDPGLRQELMARLPKPGMPYYHQQQAPDGTQYEIFVLMVVSSGKTDVLQAGGYTLDVVWVYERNAVGAVQYPLVVGVWDGASYTPYYIPYFLEHKHSRVERQEYLAYLADHNILERGRYLFPVVDDEVGGYVSLYGQIDWQKCGETTFCQVGRYMQETYRLDAILIGQAMGLNPVPAGWALAWMWDADTDRLDLPDETGEKGE